MTRFVRPILAALFAAVVSTGGVSGAAVASDNVSYTRSGLSFDDVKSDLENAIIAEGLKIDYRGNIGGMLERTGKDIGAGTSIYQHAEFVMFCSARLSRAMMEADPANMANCPFVMFTYQRAGADKEVVVGYRKLEVQGKGAETLTQINALLDKIAKNATQQ